MSWVEAGRVVSHKKDGRGRGKVVAVAPSPAIVDANAVVLDWHAATGEGSVVMIWRDGKTPGGLGLLTLGSSPRALADLDGVLVSRW